MAKTVSVSTRVFTVTVTLPTAILFLVIFLYFPWKKDKAAQGPGGTDSGTEEDHGALAMSPLPFNFCPKPLRTL